MSEAGDLLQSQVKSSLEEKPPGEWVYPLLQIGIAANQLTRSVADFHTYTIAWKESTSNETPTQSHATPQSKQVDNPGKKSGRALHPTTILGLQAVLATGLAMLAAYVLQFDKPNLVYWTAFVVIAGSTGESLRRMTMRVFGVIAGTVIGVLLSIIIPDNLWLVALLVTISFFMAIYTLTISYLWMVFWLNIAILFVITFLGGPALKLLVLRPVSTLLGAVIAAVVVVFVLPIHAQDRFVGALSGFLTGVDHYIEVYVTTLMGTSATGDLRAEELNIDASYKKLELNLPNVMYEYNPLSRAQNRLASQTTILATLRSYLNNLDSDLGGETGILTGVKDANVISKIQSHIHENISALNGFLANGQGKEMQPLAELRNRAK